MKKRILALIMLFVTVTFAAEANPIDMITAREVAMKFMNTNAKAPLRGEEDLQLVTTYNISRGDAAFYVFNMPNGFVIVSADDCATPILGYSNESQFDVNDIPIQLQDYLQDFVEQIQYGIENHLEADEATARQWEMVRSVGHLIEQRSTTAVAPLLTDTWSQDCYYNSYCPEDPNGPCGHVYAGCVATSFSQILHYWGFSTTGMGSHTYTPSGYPEQTVNFGATTYDWANMPDSLSSSSTSTEIDAVAKLMWHCGVAVDMQYGANSSSADLFSVPSAWVNYFGYSEELSIVSRNSYSDTDWLALMKSCLDLSYPIHYFGKYIYAHAFVCDGYDDNDLLHFNWGWGGNNNGYYSINAMYGYIRDNIAIIDIHPGCAPGISYQITASADPSNGGTITGADTYDCGEICTLTATGNGDYTFMYWTEDGEQVSSEASYSFIVLKDRDLEAHFTPPLTITTSANPGEGGTVSGGGVYQYNQQITLTATPNEGYIFSNWTRNGEIVSCLSNYVLPVTASAEYVAHFELKPDGIVIGEATSTSSYLPISSYYSLTQQIYTSEELGVGACEISSVSFFNTGTAKTRNFTIYMVNTYMDYFDDSYDWIPVTEAEQVFSGSVTIAAKDWTTIYFATPFSYNGWSNVALIVDDNSHSNNNGLSFRTFSTGESQAIQFSSTGTNIDPFMPLDCYSCTYTHMMEKNQVIFGIPSYDYTVTVSATPEEGGTVSCANSGPYYYGQSVTLFAEPNEGYIFSNWTRNGEIVSWLSNYVLPVTASAEYVAHFELKPDGIVIGEPTSLSSYLPTSSYYSLTQQIYTSEELGVEACEISSVSFFNTGSANTRNITIYMVNTYMDYFDDSYDWIPVTEAEQVFSGSVTVAAKGWTTIYFATPFSYNGWSNVALIVDDNSYSYNGGLSFRTFSTSESQAIRINGYGTNYDPSMPFNYTGTLMTEKNQIIFGIPSYDYTVTVSANPEEGGTVSGGGLCYYNQPITLSAVPNEGYVFKNWTKNGTVVSYMSKYNLTVKSSVEYVANFQQMDGIAVGEATSTSKYLPTRAGSYSLSQQIYTADELNAAACEISSVSFFNTVSGGTRNLTVFMVNTSKTAFDNESDWITVSEADQVFSGTVSISSRQWWTIYFNTPFLYDGSSSVALVVYENSNNGGGDMSFRTFNTEGAQALYYYDYYNEYDIDPYDPINSGTLLSVKNQVVFGIPSYDYTVTVSASPEEGGMVSCANGGLYYYGQSVTLTAVSNEGYIFSNWTKNGTVVSYLSTCNLPVTEFAEYVANFKQVNGVPIGEATSTSLYLPTHKDSYSLSQQIYTADELNGEACEFFSMSFFNTGDYYNVRNWSIYLVNTDKTSFESTSDWIPVSENDLVFSGNVTIPSHSWTTIVFSTPFTYDGSSNVALIVDGNTNGYSTNSFRTFGTEESQAICIYGADTDYDPINPFGYTGELMTEKNQLIFHHLQTVTPTANPVEGGTVSGGGDYAYGNNCTLTATPNEGYLFLHWSKNGEVVSCNTTYSFTVTEEGEIEAVFIPLEGTLIGQGEATNSRLPSCANFKYTLSQQIYTPDEIGGTGRINTISYYNAGVTHTRSFDIYMVQTDKLIFDNTTDWIPVSETDRVFSGEVTLTKGYWNTIDLDIPFAYNGVSNLAVIIDDNTGILTSNMACRVFNANGNQTILFLSDRINLDPYNPSAYSGYCYSVKNQMILGFENVVGQTIELSAGWNWFSTYIEVDDPVTMLQMVEASLDENGIQIKSSLVNTEYDSEWGWFGDLDDVGMTNEQMYAINVSAPCTVTLEGMPANPANHPITIVHGWNWIGFPSGVAISLEEAFAGFAQEGDKIKNRVSQIEYDPEWGWYGDFETLEPGQGYMYYSASSTPRTLVFPAGAK